MRKRNIRKQFWINLEEEELLKKKINKAGISESDFFRRCILNKKINEIPSKELIQFLKQLNGLANNINQIARMSNIFGSVTNKDLDFVIKNVSNFITNLETTIYSK